MLHSPSALRRILVVDDEENVRHMLQLVLSRAGYDVDVAPEVDAALKLLSEQSFDVILTDMRMPKRTGLELLAEVQTLYPKIYVIMMTAYGSVDVAVNAMSQGAYDYISKPFKPGEVLLTLRKVEEREGLVRENERLREQVASVGSLEGIIGSSRQMQDVARLAKRFAPHKTTVLLTGESGTGKELLARALHRLSDRSDGPFVAVNCAAIPESLLESELFGYVKGAFTGATKNKRGLFEEANGGTLFLDEFGEIPLSLQSKLLRALANDEIRSVGGTKPMAVDVRIVCATAQDLQALVAQGRFREDLFYRINVLALLLPPLRDRREDIPSLVEHFLVLSCKRAGKNLSGVARAAMKRLLDYPWPGNVRELEHAIVRATILADGTRLEESDLPPALLNAEVKPPPDEGLSIKKATRQLERQLISKALEQTGGNRTHAATLLEISHRTLLYKLKEYGFEARR